jgi:tetratricopeptide (TPR) repeat protein
VIRRIFCFVLCGCAVLALSCSDPLKGKPPYWYNGYVYGTRAAGFFGEGRIETALAFYKKGLAQAESHDIPEQAAQYRFNMGRCWFELDIYDSACAYFAAAHREFSLCGKQDRARQAAGFAALAFSSRHSIDSAFAWYKLGVITPSKSADKTFWLMVHGRLVWARDHTKEALAYFDEAYDLYKKQEAWHGAVEACFWRAKVYHYYGEYPDAARLLDEALALGDKTPLMFDRWRVLCAASAVSFCSRNEEKAQWFYDRAVKSNAEGNIIPPREKVAACVKEMPW